MCLHHLAPRMFSHSAVYSQRRECIHCSSLSMQNYSIIIAPCTVNAPSHFVCVSFSPFFYFRIGTSSWEWSWTLNAIHQLHQSTEVQIILSLLETFQAASSHKNCFYLELICNSKYILRRRIMLLGPYFMLKLRLMREHIWSICKVFSVNIAFPFNSYSCYIASTHSN